MLIRVARGAPMHISCDLHLRCSWCFYLCTFILRSRSLYRSFSLSVGFRICALSISMRFMIATPKTITICLSFLPGLASCQSNGFEVIFKSTTEWENMSSHTCCAKSANTPTISHVTMQFNMLIYNNAGVSSQAKQKQKKNGSDECMDEWQIFYRSDRTQQTNSDAVKCEWVDVSLFTRFGSANMQSVFFRPM